MLSLLFVLVCWRDGFCSEVLRASVVCLTRPHTMLTVFMALIYRVLTDTIFIVHQLQADFAQRR